MVLGLVMGGVLAGNSVQATTLTLQDLTTSSTARLDFDSKGNLWFSSGGSKIGKLTPSELKPGTTDGIVEYELPHANSNLQFLMVSRNDTVWFSGMEGNQIGQLDPATRKIIEYDIPPPGNKPYQLFESKDGKIWFTELSVNKIGRLDPKTGEIDDYIWTGQPDTNWSQLFDNVIGYVDLKTSAHGSVVHPPKKRVPHGIFLASDGTIWFSKIFANKIFRLDSAEDVSPMPEKLDGARNLIVDFSRTADWVWGNPGRIASIFEFDLNEAKPGSSKGVKLFPEPSNSTHLIKLILDKEGNVWFMEMGMYVQD